MIGTVPLIAHGQQVKAQFLRTSAPTSADGIEKYLSSGMIRGVGPVYGKKLVRAFGEKVFDVIEATPDRLRQQSETCPAGRGGAGPQCNRGPLSEACELV
jgi:ATP-dependent exoDNAse (exonuclease V) alpha subunit